MSKIASKPERPVAHAITNLNGRFMSVDDSFCDLLRRERHEILGETILSLTAEPYRPLNAAKLDLLREAGTSFTIRKTYLRGDGEIQPVENMVSLLRNGTGPSVLAATISLQQTTSAVGLVTSLAVARFLLRERRTRVPFGLVWNDEDRMLMLAAYVLETEGSAAWAANLAEVAGGDERANLLRIWQLVNAGVFDVDGKAKTLKDASIRLSRKHFVLMEHHLADVSSG